VINFWYHTGDVECGSALHALGEGNFEPVDKVTSRTAPPILGQRGDHPYLAAFAAIKQFHIARVLGFEMLVDFPALPMRNSVGLGYSLGIVLLGKIPLLDCSIFDYDDLVTVIAEFPVRNSPRLTVAIQMAINSALVCYVVIIF
jgi:hypothetical protein